MTTAWSPLIVVFELVVALGAVLHYEGVGVSHVEGDEEGEEDEHGVAELEVHEGEQPGDRGHHGAHTVQQTKQDVVHEAVHEDWCQY